MNRIYIITPKDADKPDPAAPVTTRLVRAPNAARALRHLTDGFNVTLATQDALVKAVGDGVAVEESGG